MQLTFLTPLLTAATNKSIEENIFPDSAKIASIVPFEKWKTNETDLLCFKYIIKVLRKSHQSNQLDLWSSIFHLRYLHAGQITVHNMLLLD